MEETREKRPAGLKQVVCQLLYRKVNTVSMWAEMMFIFSFSFCVWTTLSLKPDKPADKCNMCFNKRPKINWEENICSCLKTNLSTHSSSQSAFHHRHLSGTIFHFCVRYYPKCLLPVCGGFPINLHDAARLLKTAVIIYYCYLDYVLSRFFPLL